MILLNIVAILKWQMNLDLWLDGLIVIIAPGPKWKIKPSLQFMSEMNYLNDRSDL